MSKEDQDIEVARERLEALRTQAERIVTDSSKARRVKDMELAGVNGMIQQLEGELRSLVAGALSEQVNELRARLRGGDPKDFGAVMNGTLDLVEKLATQKI